MEAGLQKIGRTEPIHEVIDAVTLDVRFNDLVKLGSVLFGVDNGALLSIAISPLNVIRIDFSIDDFLMNHSPVVIYAKVGIVPSWGIVQRESNFAAFDTVCSEAVLSKHSVSNKIVIFSSGI